MMVTYHSSMINGHSLAQMILQWQIEVEGDNHEDGVKYISAQ